MRGLASEHKIYFPSMTSFMLSFAVFYVSDKGIFVLCWKGYVFDTFSLYHSWPNRFAKRVFYLEFFVKGE